jgi:hypothetical protein
LPHLEASGNQDAVRQLYAAPTLATEKQAQKLLFQEMIGNPFLVSDVEKTLGDVLQQNPSLKRETLEAVLRENPILADALLRAWSKDPRSAEDSAHMQELREQFEAVQAHSDQLISELRSMSGQDHDK